MNSSSINLTIGITAFNEKKFLLQAWESVIQQSSSNWKAIMVLDGKADTETAQYFDQIKHPKLKKIKFEKNSIRGTKIRGTIYNNLSKL